jgi:hypothetical protein
VTGGCRKREIGWPIRTALRELEEETRGIISITEGAYRYFYFEDAENEGIIYHVFVIEINIPRTIQLDMITRFNREKEITEERKRNRQSIRRTYDENKYISFNIRRNRCENQNRNVSQNSGTS